MKNLFLYQLFISHISSFSSEVIALADMSNKQDRILLAETELRCEVSSEEILTVQLTEGTAEIFGAELAVNKEYNFCGRNLAIFTWYGCKLTTAISPLISSQSSMTGGTVASHLYIASDSPMVSYINTHIQLEARRDVALVNNEKGPRILVVGQPDSGKTTMVKLLSNYALRLDRKPILVDLDVDQGLNSMPGSMSAIPLLKSCISVDADCSNTTTPLIYSYGHTNPKENLACYKHNVYTLAKRVKERLANDPEANASGILIDTLAWVDGSAAGGGSGNGAGILSSGESLNLIKFVANVFEVDIVLVMGADKLYSTLSSEVSRVVINAGGEGAGVTESGSAASVNDAINLAAITSKDEPVALQNRSMIVVKLFKSGGCVVRSSEARWESRRRAIHEYFYGKSLCTHMASTGGMVGSASAPGNVCSLSPARVELKLSTLKLIRVGENALHLTDGMKSIGDDTCEAANPIEVLPVKVTKSNVKDLRFTMLALVHATDGQTPQQALTEAGEAALIHNNVSGFLSVIDVVLDANNPEEDKVVVLSPCPGGELPGTKQFKYLFVGSIKYLE
jgi:energy-coupling factor transporter ATP-binding protein EcfA2